jgi:hypothetical protein
MLTTTGTGTQAVLRAVSVFLTAGVAFGAALPLDPARYIRSDEIRPGMKGFGRTVMSGTNIETFGIEVISVMQNGWYAGKDIVLIRCSGLNLEHSGIIGGMSGSPCYVVDDAGNERLIGAVAYGWRFNKDPICGVQPIEHMLDVALAREPKKKPAPDKEALDRDGSAGGGLSLAELIARRVTEPLPESSRFNVFNPAIQRAIAKRRPSTSAKGPDLQPLTVPMMVGGANPRVLEYLREACRETAFEFVASGGATAATQQMANDVRLTPGSVICIPFMTGDLRLEALGTCTEVIGDRVLGFGHSMFGDGSVELPVATGMVHTVIPSVQRSNKLGASLNIVGTLWGDEYSAIFGTTGRAPVMIPYEVDVTDLRGKRSYRYEIVQEQYMTSVMLSIGALEAIYANSAPPIEHTVKYAVEVDFKEMGTFRTDNFTSLSGVFGIIFDVQLPVMAMMDSPFGRAKVDRAKVSLTIEKGARLAVLNEAVLSKKIYKPGETVRIRVRWFHPNRKPSYTHESYDLKLPNDLPDGEYTLVACSASGHLESLRLEKPHWFRVKSLSQMLEAFNRVGSYPENRLYLRLALNRGGLAVDHVEMPDMPSFKREIITASERSDVAPFSEALVKQIETDFAVSGVQSLKIQVNRRADQ